MGCGRLVAVVAGGLSGGGAFTWALCRPQPDASKRVREIGIMERISFAVLFTFNPTTFLPGSAGVSANAANFCFSALSPGFNPHFSPDFYCGGGSRHVYCVALGRAPRHTVKYACGALRRAPCIHARLSRLAAKPGEKCGLGSQNANYCLHVGSKDPIYLVQKTSLSKPRYGPHKDHGNQD